jgi:hypothetical protein
MQLKPSLMFIKGPSMFKKVSVFNTLSAIYLFRQISCKKIMYL